MTAIIAAATRVETLRSELASAEVLPARSATASTTPAVIWLDALTPAELDHLEQVLSSDGDSSIAVHGERWDGFTAVPLAAHVRGVIGGFGLAGIETARRVIEPGD